MGRTLFFAADDGIHGEELWKSDGTAAGTVLVKNINPTDFAYAGPRSLTAVGGRLFFTADDGTHGRELWMSDGSRAGTVLVKNINPGGSPYGPDPRSLTAVGGRLFFSFDDGTHGEELWMSDGSRAGTVLVKNIAPDSGQYPGSLPFYQTAVGGRSFFTADDGTHGRELWKSDGSRAGTVLVKDIDPTDAGLYHVRDPASLTAVGDRLFFSAADVTHGNELWSSDGTRAGTVLVKNINRGTFGDGSGRGSDPSSLAAMGGRLFFAADDGTRGRELWSSDGSRAGTVLVKNIHPTDSAYGGPRNLTAVGRRLFFSADDGVRGEELWRSDGSRAGTVLVKNIKRRDYSSQPQNLTAMGRRLFFTARDGTHGPELWRSDGSRAGTVLVKNIHPCSDREYGPGNLTAVGRRLFFSADDGVRGEELWKSDGSRAGTVLVVDINTGTTR